MQIDGKLRLRGGAEIDTTAARVELSDYELDVLREAAGLKPRRALAWGAAMGVTVEHLHGLGLVARVQRDGAIVYEATEAGRAWVNSLETEGGK